MAFGAWGCSLELTSDLGLDCGIGDFFFLQPFFPPSWPSHIAFCVSKFSMKMSAKFSSPKVPFPKVAQISWGQIPAPGFTGYMTLSKSLKHTKGQCPLCKVRVIKLPMTGCLRGFNEIICRHYLKSGMLSVNKWTINSSFLEKEQSDDLIEAIWLIFKICGVKWSKCLKIISQGFNWIFLLHWQILLHNGKVIFKIGKL